MLEIYNYLLNSRVYLVRPAALVPFPQKLQNMVYTKPASQEAPFQVSSLLHSGYQHPVTRYWQSMNTRITKESLLFPIFVHDKVNEMVEIASMPGQYR